MVSCTLRCHTNSFTLTVPQRTPFGTLKRERLENERNVIYEWSEIFNLKNIDNITESALSFFDKEHNHHWPLSKGKSNINFEQIKKGLKILLDDSKDANEINLAFQNFQRN